MPEMEEKMSVKSKVKRLNKELIKLRDDLEKERLSNRRLRKKLDKQIESSVYTRQLENIVKFAITNHIGNLRGGMQIERYGIDKMQDLRLSIDYQPEFNSYIIRVNYQEENRYVKIRADVDLKELEKFGFKPDYYIDDKVFVKEFKKRIIL